MEKLAAIDKGKGFEFFRPVPYVLVQRTGAKDNPLSVQVVYLPDFDQVTHVRYRPGLFGAAEMGFTVEGGMLKSFNSKQDAKIPETLTGLGAVASGAGAALTPLASVANTAITEVSKILGEWLKPELFFRSLEFGTAGKTAPGATLSWDQILKLLDAQVTEQGGALPKEIRERPREIQALWLALEIIRVDCTVCAKELTGEDAELAKRASAYALQMEQLQQQLRFTDTAQVYDVIWFRSHLKSTADGFAEDFADMPVVKADAKIKAGEVAGRIKKGFTAVDAMLAALYPTTQPKSDFELYRIKQGPGAKPDLEKIWPLS